jgi:hypothetical protein
MKAFGGWWNFPSLATFTPWQNDFNSMQLRKVELLKQNSFVTVLISHYPFTETKMNQNVGSRLEWNPDR